MKIIFQFLFFFVTFSTCYVGTAVVRNYEIIFVGFFFTLTQNFNFVLKLNIHLVKSLRNFIRSWLNILYVLKCFLTIINKLSPGLTVTIKKQQDTNKLKLLEKDVQLQENVV